MTWTDFFYPHTVLVKNLVAGGGLGERFGAPRTLAAEVIDEQKVVRSADGAEVVSSARVSLPLPQDVPLGSLITVWAGQPQEREARVIASAVNPNTEPLDAYLQLSLE